MPDDDPDQNAIIGDNKCNLEVRGPMVSAYRLYATTYIAGVVVVLSVLIANVIGRYILEDRGTHYWQHGWPRPFVDRGLMGSDGSWSSRCLFDGASILDFRIGALTYNVVVALFILTGTLIGIEKIARAQVIQGQFSLKLLFAITVTLSTAFAFTQTSGQFGATMLGARLEQVCHQVLFLAIGLTWFSFIYLIGRYLERNIVFRFRSED